MMFQTSCLVFLFSKHGNLVHIKIKLESDYSTAPLVMAGLFLGWICVVLMFLYFQKEETIYIYVLSKFNKKHCLYIAVLCCNTAVIW